MKSHSAGEHCRMGNMAQRLRIFLKLNIKKWSRGMCPVTVPRLWFSPKVNSLRERSDSAVGTFLICLHCTRTHEGEPAKQQATTGRTPPHDHCKTNRLTSKAKATTQLGLQRRWELQWQRIQLSGTGNDTATATGLAEEGL